MKVAESKSMIELSRVKFLHQSHIECVNISVERKLNIRNRVERRTKEAKRFTTVSVGTIKKLSKTNRSSENVFHLSCEQEINERWIK